MKIWENDVSEHCCFWAAGDGLMLDGGTLNNGKGEIKEKYVSWFGARNEICVPTTIVTFFILFLFVYLPSSAVTS